MSQNQQLMKVLLTTLTVLLFGSSSVFSQNALYFDGSNDIVQTNYSGVTGSANRTFEAWVFVSPSAPSSNLCILDYGANAVGSRNTFFVSGTRQLGFISGGTNANISTPANVVPENQWVHVAFVINSGTGFLYVDGVQEGTGSLTTVNTPTTGSNVRVGQRVSGGSIPFNGVIDEVRVWSDVRTVAEIQADMNAELCGVQSNLELYLKLNEGTAGGTNTGVASAADNSGNGYIGTLTNFALTGTTSNWVNGSGISSLSTTSSVSETACGSYSLTPTSTVYTTSGIYTEALLGANSVGCDSIVTLDLTINNSTLGTDVQSACDSFTWIDGITYTASNFTATETLTNSVGCDSIVVLNLTINNNSGTDVQTACDSYLWIDGNTYTSDNNTATFTLTNAAGCDSVVTLDLTVNNASSSTDTQTSCSSYTWIDGNTYTSSNNTATMTMMNAAGCDSIITLDLTINGVSSSVTQSPTGEVLMADEVGATYQWLECPGLTPINGETNQSFTATTNGDYAVIVSNALCSDTSTCFSVTTVGVEENEFEHGIAVFPNPTKGSLSIDLGKKYSKGSVVITNVLGKQLLLAPFKDTQLIDIDLNEPSGVYFVLIESEGKQSTTRLVKE